MLDAFLNFLFPEYCMFCQRSGASICADCLQGKFNYQNLHECHVCRKTLINQSVHTACKKNTLLEEVQFVVEYDKYAKKLLHEFKYNLTFSLQKDLRQMFVLSKTKIKTNYDLVVPVPLHKKKLWWRGFNQAELLAKVLVERPSQVLLRKQNTKTQVGLSREQRLHNLTDMFIVSTDVKDKNILLIDDVMTSGATLEECAKQLKIHGASKVVAWVWAREKLRLQKSSAKL